MTGILTAIRQAVAEGVANWLPRSVVYWCAIRVAEHAATGHPEWRMQSSKDLTMLRAIGRWNHGQH